MPTSVKERRLLLDPNDPKLSIVKQCEILNISRSGYYFHHQGESPENLTLMEEIDKFHMSTQLLEAA